MIKVSTKTTYAIRALIDLARHGKSGPLRLSEIASRGNIPLPYLEQIFYKLKKAQLVLAVRGPQGGYRLAKNPQELTLVDVVTALEGPIEPVLCSMPENFSPNCHEVDGCASRVLCCELDGALRRVLGGHTLAQLSGEADRLQTVPIQFSVKDQRSSVK